MRYVARKPVASAKYENGDRLRLFELLKVYDGMGEYGVFRSDANGKLHDLNIRFDGTVDAAYELFKLWAIETFPSCRVVKHDVPRQIGRSRKHGSRGDLP